MKKLFVLFFCVVGTYASAQQLGIGRDPDIPTADVWNFINYGINEPSLYTGTNTVNIPFYVYRDPDFELPISFSYASNGYRPNMQTGILGLDWSLIVGGYVSREVKGLPDEFYNTDVLDSYAIGDLKEFDPDNPYIHTAAAGFMKVRSADNSMKDISETNSPTLWTVLWGGSDVLCYKNLNSLNIGIAEPFLEVEPDIFRFNFMGYSGTFYLWYDDEIVIYDTNMPEDYFKIELIDDDLISIIITTADGYQYIFGGYSEVGDPYWEESFGSCSYEYAYTGYDDEATPTGPFPIAWKLSKVIAPNGRMMLFTYSDNEPVNNYRPAPNDVYAGLAADYHGDYYDYDRATPVLSQRGSSHLESIRCDSTLIRFEYYTDSIPHEKYWLGDIFGTNYKLSKIEVISPENEVVRRCSMHYAFASNNNPITFLDKLVIDGEGEYSFSYIDQTGDFPIQGSFAVDHWGYYNGKVAEDMTPSRGLVNILQVDSVYDEIIVGTDNRQCNWQFARKGMLEKIVYPTGGYSTFEYEPHTVSAKVNRTSATMYNPVLETYETNSMTGGVRLRKIVNYDADDTVCDSTSYLYNLPGSDLSSGVQLYFPRYGLGYLRHHITDGWTDITNGLYLVRLNNVFSYGDKNVEYSSVAEVKSDGSFIRYDYDSYRSYADFEMFWFDGKIMDREFDTNSFENDFVVQKIIAPVVSRRFLRGRLTSQKVYSADSTVQREIITNYRYEPLIGEMPAIPMIIGDKYGLAIRYKGNNMVRHTVSRDYFDGGNSALGTTYDYDAKYKLRAKSVNGTHSRIEQYEYADEYASQGGIYQAMLRRNLTGVPVSTTIYKGSSTLIGGLRYQFDSLLMRNGTYAILPVVSEVVDTDASDSDNIVWRENAYYVYDRLGRMIQQTDANGIAKCYVWGHNGLYPVAVVENATVSQIKTLGGELSSIDVSPLAGGLSVSAETALRTIPNAAVTVYRYKPLVGVTSVTTPDGLSTYYEYTAAGKLKSITDSEGSPVSKYDYSNEN